MMPNPSGLLRDLYLEDQREHGAVPPVGTSEYVELRARDRTRRTQAESALRELREGTGPSLDDLYHTAWLLNHGDKPEQAHQAHDLATQAARGGHAAARWLAAAAYDRWCMYEGRAQKYGTQFVPDGFRYRLWDVDATTTDEERAAWNVPSLAEQERRAEQLTRDYAQPPLEGAPEWLRAAVARWSAEKFE